MAKLLRFDLRRGALLAAGLLVLVGLLAARFDYAPTDTPPINANQSAQQIHPRELRNRDGDPIAESPVVIVNIDRDSLDRVGPWPWNGDILAILLSNLYAYGVVSVGLDVIFETPGEDAVFASALQSGPQVYLKPGANPAVVGPRGSRGVEFVLSKISAFDSDAGNSPLLDANAPGRGMVTVWPDSDGVVRRAPLAVAIGGEIYASLTIEMLRLAVGRATYLIRYGEKGIERIERFLGFPNSNRRMSTAEQNRSKGRRKTGPFSVMRYAVLRVVPLVHRRAPRCFA